MDSTVALVQAYLQVNGYFTVAEYPILTVNKRGKSRAATDIDLLAFRFPGAGKDAIVPFQRHAVGETFAGVDPALCCPHDRPDMILGEVKRGHAHFNPAMRDPLVVATALMRFGCCKPDAVEQIARTLLKEGRAETHCGHQVRLVAFGSQAEGGKLPVGQSISLSTVIAYLNQYLHAHWSVLHQVKFSNDALEMLALNERMSGSG